MRLKYLAVVAFVACQPTAKSPSVAQAVESEGWSVTALAPSTPNATEIFGSMTLERTEGAETRGGGVCLVADLNGAHACETAADCAALPLPDGGFHYCAGAAGVAAKVCWTRPGAGETYCNRSPTRVAGTFQTPNVPKMVGGKQTLWMSYACLAAAAAPMACGGTDPSLYVSATSPTTTISP